MPANVYKDSAGKRLPSVTTILGRSKSSDGLIHWAWNEGREGRDYRESRDTAASIGTHVHELIEAYLRGDPVTPRCEQSDAAMSAFVSWFEDEGIEIVTAEVMLSHDGLGYGGQFDLLGKMGERYVIFDWKTSPRLYPEMVAQIAAYRELVWQTHVLPLGTPVFGAPVLLGKEASFVDPYLLTPDMLDVGWHHFKAAHDLYVADKATSALVRRLKTEERHGSQSDSRLGESPAGT